MLCQMFATKVSVFSFHFAVYRDLSRLHLTLNIRISPSIQFPDFCDQLPNKSYLINQLYFLYMLRILYIPDTNMQGQKYDTFLNSQNLFQGF